MEIHRYSDIESQYFADTDLYVISQKSKMTSWQFYFSTFEFNSIHLLLNTENMKWNAANAVTVYL
jgi:hypothetical protein